MRNYRVTLFASELLGTVLSHVSFRAHQNLEKAPFREAVLQTVLLESPLCPLPLWKACSLEYQGCRNGVSVPCRTGVLTKLTTMTILHSTHKDEKHLLLRPQTWTKATGVPHAKAPCAKRTVLTTLKIVKSPGREKQTFELVETCCFPHSCA